MDNGSSVSWIFCLTHSEYPHCLIFDSVRLLLSSLRVSLCPFDNTIPCRIQKDLSWRINAACLRMSALTTTSPPTHSTVPNQNAWPSTSFHTLSLVTCGQFRYNNHRCHLVEKQWGFQHYQENYIVLDMLEGQMRSRLGSQFITVKLSANGKVTSSLVKVSVILWNRNSDSSHIPLI